jgi:serine/threonine protein kinase/tetratricopeptide (TPR) repeat protein
MIGQTLGHYRILEKVAAGGMGVVYRAHDEQLERDVALKVLPPGTITDNSSRRQFRKEALALGKLSHPNIETIYEFDTQDGIDFLVMEYVPGNTLAERLGSGALPEKEVVALGMQITAAMEEAHNRGIVHRDLKPRNIAITERGQAKVLDFGLAKLLPKVNEVTAADTLTDTQTGAGTLPYMPPEQLQGESVDARADIYTIGAVLYEMATDRRAFPEELPSRVINAILHHPPVAPRALNPRISPELERIILKCLDKDPSQRFQSAKELLVDLRRLGTTSSTTALTTPPPPAPDVLKRALRIGTYVVAGLLALAVLMTGLNIGGWRDRLLGRPRPGLIKSLAVLPLENRSHDPEQDYFADGMTDELITELAGLNAVRVISRTSVMRFKNTDKSLPEIARSLNVDAVVEGSVQRVGDRVKISARLLEARTDQELWARSYERDLSDVLGLQREVAEAIAGSIEATLAPAPVSRKIQSVDPAAHEAYLKGLYYWNKRTPEGLKRALQYFQQAIDKDPNYALAYAGLSYTYAFAPELGLSSDAAKDKQKTAALKAVALDDTLPEAHTALAGALQNQWDWADAEQQYKRSIQLNPNYATARHWYSIYLSVVGRHEEAIAQAKRALELDPLSLIIQANLGGRYLRSGRYQEAIQECQKAIEMDPTFAVAHNCVGYAYLQMARAPEAVAEFQTAVRLSGGDTESVSALGYAFAASGRGKEAAEILGQLQSPSGDAYLPAYYIAIVDCGLGRKDETFAWLERAYRNRTSELPEVKTDPMFLKLREDRRFNELLQQIGLPL